jgi:hypothetical protein
MGEFAKRKAFISDWTRMGMAAVTSNGPHNQFGGPQQQPQQHGGVKITDTLVHQQTLQQNQ